MALLSVLAHSGRKVVKRDVGVKRDEFPATQIRDTQMGAA
jgi:hypothetical protein